MTTHRVGTGLLKTDFLSALNRSKPGDKIRLAEGTYELPDTISINNLTIEGESARERVTLHATLVVSGTLTIKNLTLQALPYHNALSIKRNGNLVVDNCHIIGESGSKYPAIYGENSFIQIFNSQVVSTENANVVPATSLSALYSQVTIYNSHISWIGLNNSIAKVTQLGVKQIVCEKHSKLSADAEIRILENDHRRRPIFLSDESVLSAHSLNLTAAQAQFYVSDSLLEIHNLTSPNPIAVYTENQATVNAPDGTVNLIDNQAKDEPPLPKTVTWHPTQTWEEISKQLNSGDTLKLGKGTYEVGQQLVVDFNIEGQGEESLLKDPIFIPHSAVTVSHIRITAEVEDRNPVRIADAEDVTIDTVTLPGGNLPGVGITNSTVHLKNCQIETSPTAQWEEIFADGSKISLENCRTYGIVIDHETELQLSNCELGWIRAGTNSQIKSTNQVKLIAGEQDGQREIVLQDNCTGTFARINTDKDDLEMCCQDSTLTIKEINAPFGASLTVIADGEPTIDVPAQVNVITQNETATQTQPEQTTNEPGEPSLLPPDATKNNETPPPHCAEQNEGGAAETSALEEIKALTGLATVKEQILEFTSLAAFNEMRRQKGYAEFGGTLHSLFLGNPGTGKTTVARLLGRALYEAGAIPTDTFVEVSQEDLISPNIGETPMKTRRVLEEARGGVLFIDEAYSLYQSSGTNYGAQAVDTILKFMEDNRREIVIIFAGYTDKMQDFLSMNPGLKSRITNRFDFEDYTPDEISEMGYRELIKDDYLVDEEAYKRAAALRYRASSDHSNGRWVRNFNEKLVRTMITRAMQDPHSDAQTITNEDIQKMLGTNADQDTKLEDVLAEIDALTGLQAVKDFAHDLVLQAQADKKLLENGQISEMPTYHMAFTGNPGTGKTTVARLLGKIFYALGILQTPTVVEVDRSDLVGSYVGHTEANTARAIETALGGILFVDEAYQLTSNASENDFGRQAVESLITALENHRSQFVAIFAGYTQPMETFLDANPGLRSRIPLTIEFADYSPTEVAQMTADVLRKNWEFDEAELTRQVATAYQNTPVKERANGRWARNTAQRIERAHKRWFAVQDLDLEQIRRIPNDIITEALADFGTPPTSNTEE